MMKYRGMTKESGQVILFYLDGGSECFIQMSGNDANQLYLDLARARVATTFDTETTSEDIP